MADRGYNESKSQAEWDESKKVVLELLQSQGLMLGIEVSILAVIVLWITCCCWRRPKTTGVFILLWFAWLLCHVLRSAMDEGFKSTISELHAKERKVIWYTSNLIIAFYLCLVEWINLLIPFVKDIKMGCQAIWKNTPEEYRPFLILGLIAILGLSLAVRQAVRHQDTVKKGGQELCCQLSFIVIAPLVYCLLTFLPVEAGVVVAFCTATALPILHSLNILRAYRSERERMQKEEDDLSLLRVASIKLMGKADDTPETPAYQVARERLYRLVAFWACWPFIRSFGSMIDQRILVKETQQPAAYGVFVAIVLWLLLWHGSYIVPWIFSMLTSCCACCGLIAHRVASTVREETGDPLKIVQWYRNCVEKNQSKLVGGIGVVMVLLVLGSVAIVQLKPVNQALSVMFLVAVALDSAARVGNREEEMCARRCGFWIVTVLWVCITKIPVAGDVLQHFNLVVYIGGLVAGESISGLLISFMSLTCGRCLDRLNRVGQVSDEPEGEDKRRADAENGGLEMSSFTSSFAASSFGDATSTEEKEDECRRNDQSKEQEQFRRSASDDSKPAATYR